MIPVVDRSKEIERCLHSAHYDSCQPRKLSYYCEAAKLQYASQLYNDAQAAYEKARFVMELWKVSDLLKVSKVAILLKPYRVPYELKKAEELITDQCSNAERDPDEKSRTHYYAVNLAKVAKRYFQLNQNAIGTRYLDQAMLWASYGRRLDTELDIVKACVKGDKRDECSAVVQIIQNYIPTLRSTTVLASFLISLTEVLLPFERKDGEFFLEETINYCNSFPGDRILLINTDMRTIKVLIKENQIDQCIALVKTMQKYIPHNDDDFVKMELYLTLSELVLPIDKNYGTALLLSAKELIEKWGKTEANHFEKIKLAEKKLKFDEISLLHNA